MNFYLTFPLVKKNSIVISPDTSRFIFQNIRKGVPVTVTF